MGLKITKKGTEKQNKEAALQNAAEILKDVKDKDNSLFVVSGEDKGIGVQVKITAFNVGYHEAKSAIEELTKPKAGLEMLAEIVAERCAASDADMAVILTAIKEEREG